jgi:hypothetical protein
MLFRGTLEELSGILSILLQVLSSSTVNGSSLDERVFDEAGGGT